MDSPVRLDLRIDHLNQDIDHVDTVKQQELCLVNILKQ
jgi:hypothetical protein